MAMQVGRGLALRLHGGPLEAVADPRLLKAVRDAAVRQEAEARRISEVMYEALRNEIAVYAAIKDEAMVRDVQSVSAAIVRLWLKAVRDLEIADEDLTPVREGARRRARQGVDLQSLLKAYRIGIRVMWRELLLGVESDHPAAGPLLAVLAEWALDFTDALSTEVANSYLDEQQQMAVESQRRRSALLELVLEGRLERSQLQLLPELQHPHAVLVGAAAGTVPLQRLDRLATILEKHLRVRLWTVRHNAIVAVIPRGKEERSALVRRLEDLVRNEPAVARVGLGGDAQGPGTTASSYVEATEALRVGQTLFADAARVYQFPNTGLYALAARDGSVARRWADNVLAGLPIEGRHSWVLETIEQYVLQRGNVKRVATALGVHSNTVKYRIAVLKRDFGVRLHDGAHGAELLVAIRLLRLLQE